MSSMTNYLENKIIDQIFRGIPYSAPAVLYVGLLTTVPDDTGTGTEVSGGSYARVPIAANTSNFFSTNGTTSGASSGTNGTTRNAVAVTFPAPTDNWGQIQASAIYDAASGGNMLLHSPLLIAKTVNNGDAAPSFNPNSLTVILA